MHYLVTLFWMTLSSAHIFHFIVNFQVFRTNIWLSYLTLKNTCHVKNFLSHSSCNTGNITTQPFDFIQMAAWISLLGTHIYVNAHHFIIDATHLWDYTEHSLLLSSKCYFLHTFWLSWLLWQLQSEEHKHILSCTITSMGV